MLLNILKKTKKKYTKLIDEMELVDICYSEDPKRPFLCSIKTMHLNPSEYKQYPAILNNHS
jgi:hypothetical protein